jgi:hypothetical protein
VKTLGDADASRINLQPLPSTVQELASQPAPSAEELRQHADSRIDGMGDPPVELSTYTVRVVLLQFKRETDEDIHLVIADPDDPSQTMIAEFPEASCLPGTDPALAQQMQSARDSLVGLCGEPQPRFEPCPVSAQVTGAGFFDFQHGQTGVAPNAIELHPVLDVQPSASPDATAEPAPAATPEAITVEIVSIQGARPGQQASTTVKTTPSAQCVPRYTTPAGTNSAAQGLGPKTADSGGTASWSWFIGTNTRPGTGTIYVTCGGAQASAPIEIG